MNLDKILPLIVVASIPCGLMLYIKAGIYAFGKERIDNENAHPAIHFIVKCLFIIVTVAFVAWCFYCRFFDGDTARYDDDDFKQFDPR